MLNIKNIKRDETNCKNVKIIVELISEISGLTQGAQPTFLKERKTVIKTRSQDFRK